eukprot:TRINITY_DN5848_c0_g1_i4.p5 TRINITY_DN5848_c0_g1~~TRINITY_DN5848_c0_g1_i4.p5  ORF type:complete len:168 (+),score=8.58 TRINITY_DN5848_c0_g1_i4:1234-1737(+)
MLLLLLCRRRQGGAPAPPTPGAPLTATPVPSKQDSEPQLPAPLPSQEECSAPSPHPTLRRLSPPRRPLRPSAVVTSPPANCASPALPPPPPPVQPPPPPPLLPRTPADCAASWLLRPGIGCPSPAAQGTLADWLPHDDLSVPLLPPALPTPHLEWVSPGPGARLRPR